MQSGTRLDGLDSRLRHVLYLSLGKINGQLKQSDMMGQPNMPCSLHFLVARSLEWVPLSVSVFIGRRSYIRLAARSWSSVVVVAIPSAGKLAILSRNTSR